MDVFTPETRPSVKCVGREHTLYPIHLNPKLLTRPASATLRHVPKARAQRARAFCAYNTVARSKLDLRMHPTVGFTRFVGVTYHHQRIQSINQSKSSQSHTRARRSRYLVNRAAITLPLLRYQEERGLTLTLLYPPQLPTRLARATSTSQKLAPSTARALCAYDTVTVDSGQAPSLTYVCTLPSINRSIKGLQTKPHTGKEKPHPSTATEGSKPCVTKCRRLGGL